MARARMHDDEVDVDAAFVARLLADQFPQWSQLPVEPVSPRALGTSSAGSWPSTARLLT